MNIKSFLTRCITEVLSESKRTPSHHYNKKLVPLVKQCLAEVIVEPFPRKKKIYGTPTRLKTSCLIKECVLEVLKENLTETFDPLSQGPNIPQENPYPEMNSKMRKLEERGGVIYKNHENGKWVYWVDSDGNRLQIHPKNVQKYLRQGYKIVAWGRANDPEAMKNVSGKGIMEIDPHGRYAQQAGATPFKSPGDTSIVEYDDHQATITKIKNEVFSALANMGFQHLGDAPRDHMEYYLNGFVTVSIYISYDENAAIVERYYDSEMLNNIPGHHVDAKVPIPEKYDPSVVQKLIKLCNGLKQRAQGDESIFGGIEDIEESKTQSTNIKWICPNCGQSTDIPIEIESPSDYIAGSDCEHCGKEISDPKLDQKIYGAVIDYYSSKADYLKDTHP